jgi:hypothetical protein
MIVISAAARGIHDPGEEGKKRNNVAEIAPT